MTPPLQNEQPGRAYVIQSNATCVPLADKSVHCNVSSPPYWALRSYLPKDSPLKSMEFGSEPTPELFVSNLVAVYREVRRVLRDDGNVFVNLGDCYHHPDKGGYRKGRLGPSSRLQASNMASDITGSPHRSAQAGLKDMDRVGIPERFALAMQADGWYWRDVIIWSKSSPMPLSLSGWRWEQHRVKVRESARAANGHKHSEVDRPHGARDGKAFASSSEYIDCPGCKKCEPNGGLILRKGAWRTTTAHEYLFHFTKTDTYYGDREAVATPAKEGTVSRNKYSRIGSDPDEQYAVAHDHEFTGATANLRSVWRISSEPMKEKHYATFPSRLPELCLLATTSAKGVCPACGAPWARVIERVDTGKTQKMADGWDTGDGAHGAFHRAGREAGERDVPVMGTSTAGWRPTCRCPLAQPVPAIVLDHFGGSGRTAKAAVRNGRIGISCDLDPANIAIARAEILKAFAPRKVKAKARIQKAVPVVRELHLFSQSDVA